MDPQDVMIWSMARCHDPARPATYPLKRVVCGPPPGVNRSEMWTCRRTDCSFLEYVAPHPSTWVASCSEAVPTQDPFRPTHCGPAESYENASMPASESILEATECGSRRWKDACVPTESAWSRPLSTRRQRTHRVHSYIHLVVLATLTRPQRIRLLLAGINWTEVHSCYSGQK